MQTALFRQKSIDRENAEERRCLLIQGSFPLVTSFAPKAEIRSVKYVVQLKICAISFPPEKCGGSKLRNIVIIFRRIFQLYFINESKKKTLPKNGNLNA